MNVKQHYTWSNPFFEGMADANKVAAELDKIEQKNGDLQPADIVKFARNKRTELHKLFTWDDQEAARMQRESTARNVVRSLRIVVHEHHEPERKLRVWVNAPEDPGYVRITQVSKDHRQSIGVYLKMLRELENMVDRYSEVVGQLPTIKTSIDDIVEQLRDEIKARESRRAAE